MSLGTLTIDIAANLARLESDLGKANRLSAKFAEDQRKRYERIGKLIGTAIAGFATGAFAGWIKQSIDAADAAAETAQAIGISVESFQALSYAASTAGVEQESLTGALNKFNKTIAQAAAGGKKQAAAFADIGVSVRDSNGELKDADKVLLEVADKFQGYEDGANKAALAQDLFGKSGAKLIPLLNSGKEGITDLMTEAQKLGLVMSAKDAAAADQFNDSLTALDGVGRGMANNLASALLPYLNDLSGLMLDLAGNADTANESTSGLGETMKFVTALAISLGTQIQMESISLAGFAAAAVQAGSGDFAIAADTLKTMKADMDAAEAKGNERIDKLYDGSFRKKGEEAAATAGRYRKELERQNAETNKGATAAQKATDAIEKQIDALKEQAATVGMTTKQTTLYKLAQDGATASQLAAATAALEVVEAYEKSQKTIKDTAERVEAFNRVQESTFTDGQKLLQDYQTAVETLRKSLNAGDINQGQYDDVMGGLDKGLSKAQDKLTETKDQLDVFADEAARNAQDAFADFLFDPFADGLDGMAANFGKVLQRMVAEAAAAQIMRDALGTVGADGERTGGFLQAGLKAAGAFFGFAGGKAVGGPVEAGKLYEVGENDAPEMFMANGRQFLIPGNSGSIKPQGTPGGNSTQVFNITTPDANSFRASQRQIARRAKSQMSQT